MLEKFGRAGTVAFRRAPITSVITVGLLGALVAAAAIAATTGHDTFGPERLTTNRDPDRFNISSSDWQDLPGASTSVFMPADSRVVILARFSAESSCVGAGAVCSVRVLVDGVEAAPTGAEHFDTGTAEAADDGITNPMIERSRGGLLGLPAGDHTIKLQVKRTVGSEPIQASWIQNWHLSVEAARWGVPR